MTYELPSGSEYTEIPLAPEEAHIVVLAAMDNTLFRRQQGLPELRCDVSLLSGLSGSVPAVVEVASDDLFTLAARLNEYGARTGAEADLIFEFGENGETYSLAQQRFDEGLQAIELRDKIIGMAAVSDRFSSYIFRQRESDEDNGSMFS